MNRRGFLQALGLGAVGAVAALHLPASIVTQTRLQPYGHLYACERLRAAYLAFQKTHGYPPGCLRIGQKLYEMFQTELHANQRFCSNDAALYGIQHLMFKGAVVVPSGGGYDIYPKRVLEYARNVS